MDIVVNAALIVESSRLPELAAHLASLVPVEQELTDEADAEEACCIGLTTCVEGTAEVTVVFHAALVGPHLDKAVVGANVGQVASRKRSHSLHAHANRIERHAGDSAASNSRSRGPSAIDPARAEEEVRVLLAPVVNVGHGGANGSDAEAVGNGATKKHALFGCAEDAVEDAAVVASALLRVELIDLHTSEDEVDRVGQDTREETTAQSSHNVPVRASRAPRVRIQPVIEEEEAPDSGRRVRHGLGDEAVPASEHL